MSLELLFSFEKSMLKSPRMIVCEHGSVLMNWLSYLCSFLKMLLFFSGCPYMLMILRIFAPVLFVRSNILMCSDDLSTSFVIIISFLTRNICPADRYFSEFLWVAAVYNTLNSLVFSSLIVLDSCIVKMSILFSLIVLKASILEHCQFPFAFQVPIFIYS